MKIIHTSDWHLGRSFGPLSLLSDQEAFVDWFVDLVTDEAADLVVIAGDLYDRAVAPTDAIGLFRDAIGRLLATGTVVAAITGNHDGADRVAPYSELLDLSRFYLRGGYDRVGSVITHDFTDGPLDLVLLPYLDPRAAPRRLRRSNGRRRNRRNRHCSRDRRGRQTRPVQARATMGRPKATARTRSTSTTSWNDAARAPTHRCSPPPHTSPARRAPARDRSRSPTHSSPAVRSATPNANWSSAAPARWTPRSSMGSPTSHSATFTGPSRSATTTASATRGPRSPTRSPKPTRSR